MLLKITRGYCCDISDHQQTTLALENAKHRVSTTLQDLGLCISKLSVLHIRCTTLKFCDHPPAHAACHQNHVSVPESATSIPSPCCIIASCCTHFLCLFVHLFVRLVGCCIVSLPLAIAHPIPSRRRASHVIALLFISRHPSHLVAVESSRRRIFSPCPSPLVAQFRL